jgi:CHAT domain-containing protein/Flp pilus assembly protein TadD
MHRPVKSASLIAATLLLCLASPLKRIGITLFISKALAQAPTSQDRTAKEVAMPKASPVNRATPKLCQNLQLLHTFESSATSVVVNPDGQTFVSGERDGTIKLRNLETGEVLRTLKGHSGEIKSLAISSDGRILASGSSNYNSKDNSSNIDIKIWNLHTGELLHSLDEPTDLPKSMSVAISPDGQSLISSWNKVIKIWNLATGELLRTLEGESDVAAIAVSPDSQILVSSYDSTIKLWNLATGELLRTLSEASGVKAIAISPDGQTLVGSTGYSEIKVWNLLTGELLRTLTGHSGFVYSVAISPDGQTLAGGTGNDDTIELWNLLTGDAICTLPKPDTSNSVTFSRDGQTLIRSSQSITSSENGRVDVMLLSEACPSQPALQQQAQANRLNEIALQQFNQGNFRAALKPLWQALDVYRELCARAGTGKTLYNLGEAYLNSWDERTALGFYELALPIFRELGDRTAEADALNGIGDVYTVHRRYRNSLEPGQFSKALEFLSQALAIYREVNHRAGEANILSDMGLIYSLTKRSTQSLEYFQQGLKIYRETGNLAKQAETLRYLRQVHRVQHQHERASEVYQQELAVRKTISDSLPDSSTSPAAKRTILNELAEGYYQLGQYPQAVESLQQLLAISRASAEHYEELKTLYKIAEVYHQWGEYPQALEFYQKALMLTSENRSIFHKSIILNEMGKIYLSIDQYSHALEFFQQALALKETNERAVLNNIGLVYEKLGEYSQALEFFHKALGLPEKTEEKSFIIIGRGGIPKDATLVDSLDHLVASLEQSLWRKEALGSKEEAEYGKEAEIGKGTALVNIGEVYRKLGQYRRALDFLERALTTFKLSKDSPRQAVTLNNIGVVYKSQGEYQQALESYQKALAIKRELGDKAGEALVLNNIGEIYRNQGQYPQAFEHYHQALKIFQSFRSIQSQGGNLSILGSTVNDSLPNEIIRISNENLIITNGAKVNLDSQLNVIINQPISHRRGEGATLHNLGVVYNELGQYSIALNLYKQALAIRKEIGDKVEEGNTLNNIGIVYNQLGQNSQALKYYQQALAVQREASDKAGEGTILNNIGLVYDELGQSSQSLESLNQALGIFKQLGDQSSIGNTLDSIGTVYTSLKQYPQALEFYQQALGFLRKVGNRAGERTTLSNMGSLLEKQNQPELAITFYKQSVNLTEIIRTELQVLPREEQKSYTQTVADTYRALANLLLSQGRILEAQKVLELLKVQEIRDFAKDTRAGESASGIDISQTEKAILDKYGSLIAFGQRVYECKQTACSQVNELNAQLEELTRQYNQSVATFEAEIRTRRASDDSSFDPRLLGNAQAIVEAQPGTLLIYPFVLDDKIWLLWVGKGGVVKSHPISHIGQKPLSELVVKFRSLLNDPASDIAQVQATGKQLYDILLKPIEAELKANNIQNLVFALDRVTRYIPMSALHDGQNYLIENYTVSTVLSAELTNIKEHRLANPQATSVLGLGLSEAKAGFNPLPHVPDELDAVVRQDSTDRRGIYPGLKFLNQAFNREVLRNNLVNQQVLHIATHGKFVPTSYLDSFLLLGTGEKLTIEDIKALPYMPDIQLVVLSACESALGGNLDGIEISSMSYYFLSRGAKAVMASLWLVNDASTSQLMQQFYSNLAAGTPTAPVTKAEALRQAQLSMLHGEAVTTINAAPRRSLGVRPIPDFLATSTNRTTPGFSHPYYWAPFILIGNGF